MTLPIGFFANGINMPLVLGYGIAILVPLMAFEVFVEAFVLGRLWKQPWGEMCRLTFRANCWSLVAGLPVKLLNAGLASWILPTDLQGYFEEFPKVAVLSAATFFVVTILVEGLVARAWLREQGTVTPRRSSLWAAVLLANVITYSVLAPLYYYATRPNPPEVQFTRDSSWTANPETQVLFVHPETGHLLARPLGSTNVTVVMPHEARDYLVSADLNLCLYRGTDNNLYLHQRASGKSVLVWATKERFLMNQVAFSPTGRYVAIATDELESLLVVEVMSGRTNRVVTPHNFDWSTKLAWTTDENEFMVDVRGINGTARIVIGPSLELSEKELDRAHPPELLVCYGRIDGGAISSGGHWGTYYHGDECNGVKAWVEPGLGSGLRVYRDKPYQSLFSLSVRHGLLRLSFMHFEQAAFLPVCDELVFSAEDNVYLLHIPSGRICRLSQGKDFILFSPKFQKDL